MNAYGKQLLLNLSVVLGGSLVLLFVGNIKLVLHGPWFIGDLLWIQLLHRGDGFEGWSGSVICACATVAIMLLVSKSKMLSILVDIWFILNIAATFAFVVKVADA